MKNFWVQPEYKKKHRERSLKRRAANMQWIFEYKKTHPCVDCGEDDPIVLQFDHIQEKTMPVTCYNYAKLERLQAEVEKCVIRCANCHVRKTAKQFNWPILTLIKESGG